jgi:PKD repeat protein
MKPSTHKLVSFTLSLGWTLLALGAVPTQASEPAQVASQRAPFPQLTLPAKAQGEQAIRALGARLPEVAAWYGMSVSDFARLLRSDTSAWLDKGGRLFYVEDFPEPALGSEPVTSEAAPFPLNSTFLLHSRPGANRVIYLDFDGHVTSGTAWNASSGIDPIVSPAYNTDADPNSFSIQELENIQKMWQQVSEDFVPFDVDVTTEDPGVNAINRSSSGDTLYGTRVVITQDNFDNCGCGGFAYVGVFDNIGSYYKPAFVFNTGVVGAGEAISHETGHNLGLSHDGVIGGPAYYAGHGSGATGWAPIMGVGYYQSLVQWSKGEYANANQLQDDIVVIQSNGAPLRSDDHGNSNIAATPLTSTNNGTSLSGQGIISTRQDVDVFSFVAGSGAYSLSVQGAPFKPNLDISIGLYDSFGNLVASDNPAAGLSASLAGASLAAGEYFLRIDGAGLGDPLTTGYSDYGSLGEYAISGSVTAPIALVPPVAVASVDYTPGFAPLTASFDGSASSDADGTIVGYDWDFGDGNTDSGAFVDHIYAAPGTFQATLTVTDNDGLSSNHAVTVTVDNQPPLAQASADSYSGTAPLTVNFSSAGSSDPDGNLAAFLWDFGDGATSTQTGTSHNYNAAGNFIVSLTVTDNLGASDTTSLAPIQVDAAPFLDQFATAEIAAGGTITGSYLDTRVDDGNAQRIAERESGGKKNQRYSYLQHTWVFNVQPGESVTLMAHVWQSVSTDGDTMAFSYSSAGQTDVPLLSTGNGWSANDPGMLAIPLPASLSGEVRITARDSDRSAGHTSLDSVYVDALYIRTDNQVGGTVPNAPSALTADALSSSGIALGWTDNAADELGFRVERSDDLGLNWQLVNTTAADVTSYTDTGLAPSTEYYYRVLAFNGAGFSVASAEAAATTMPGSSLVLTANGYKVKGGLHVALSWNGGGLVDLYRDNLLIYQNPNAGSSTHTDNLGVKGAGSYLYWVCPRGSQLNCSATVGVVF